MWHQLIRPALVLFALLSSITGGLYPLLVTGLAQGLFPHQAHGSLIERDGQWVGSSLIGQSFTSARYFWGRPSATSPTPNDANGSSGSNLGPINPALLDSVKARIHALHAVDPENTLPVPVDLVTASASGLDPHISVAAARYQAGRVARERQMSLAEVQRLIELHTEGRDGLILGEPRVNVLQINLALDQARPKPH
ncbi:potassium-transporting ATPase subunit KdpC [Leptothrix ochracea]|uniref:potassium-transporting ATPase subunit KdpC n=1 Tax=Leptothrix ochracea TaxID=735331 RepID=UPI0034E260BD